MDKRLLGKIGCFIQSALSVKEGGPRFKHWKVSRGEFVIAYPPYLAGAVKLKSKWIQFRLGIRYDRFWKGYIFPCISLKKVDEFIPF